MMSEKQLFKFYTNEQSWSKDAEKAKPFYVMPNLEELPRDLYVFKYKNYHIIGSVVKPRPELKLNPDNLITVKEYTIPRIDQEQGALTVDFYDFTGKLNNVIRISLLAKSSQIINVYDSKNKTLLASLCYEVFPSNARKEILPVMAGGPYLYKQNKNKDFIVFHTVYVLPEFRTCGLLKEMINKMAERELPVYVYLWINRGLEDYFNKNLKPNRLTKNPASEGYNFLASGGTSEVYKRDNLVETVVHAYLNPPNIPKIDISREIIKIARKNLPDNLKKHLPDIKNTRVYIGSSDYEYEIIYTMPLYELNFEEGWNECLQSINSDNETNFSQIQMAVINAFQEVERILKCDLGDIHWDYQNRDDNFAWDNQNNCVILLDILCTPIEVPLAKKLMKKTMSVKEKIKSF